MIRRRFLNIVTENYNRIGSGINSLHRLDVSERLFYPSPAVAAAAATGGDESQTTVETVQQLPSPWFRIPRAPTKPRDPAMAPIFGRIGAHSRESKILCIDESGYALVADANLVGMGAVGDYFTQFPTLRDDKGSDPLLITAAAATPQDRWCQQIKEDIVYVMDRSPRCSRWQYTSCFDVLEYVTSGGMLRCQWQALPPPPFVGQEPRNRHEPVGHLCSHTVVDDDGRRNICVSFDAGVGSYCFNTVERAWSHVGDWVLPFHGGAEHDPDLGVLVGFSAEKPNHLCLASDSELIKLISTGKKLMEKPPRLLHLWQESVAPETQNWLPLSFRLISMGSGRFCIAKLFRAKRNSTLESDSAYAPDVECHAALLIGIQICIGSRGPDVLMHKSLLYQSMDNDGIIKCVL